MIFFAINYRVKKTGRFRTTQDDSKKREETETVACFQNPVYDVSEVLTEEPAYSHDNPVYQMTDDPDGEI